MYREVKLQIYSFTLILINQYVNCRKLFFPSSFFEKSLSIFPDLHHRRYHVSLDSWILIGIIPEKRVRWTRFTSSTSNSFEYLAVSQCWKFETRCYREIKSCCIISMVFPHIYEASNGTDDNKNERFSPSSRTIEWYDNVAFDIYNELIREFEILLRKREIRHRNLCYSYISTIVNI